MTVQKIAKTAKLRKTKTLNNLLRTMKTLLPEYALYAANPMSFVPKISRSVHLNKNAAKLAWYIVDKITRKRVLVGAHPNTVAGAAIYWASKLRKEEIDINQLAKAADCATQTIRNIYYKMECLKDIIFL
jgi:transcription initiation factor TFIIIB Brf1 subunit/transcription initiation factor TFIIB